MPNYFEFNQLQYSAPLRGNVGAAVAVIKDILATAPSLLPYLMEPSAILLFAHLRAQSPYHKFGDEITYEQRAKLETVLGKHGFYVLNEDTSYDIPKTDVFSLINPSVFEAIPIQYGFIKELWKSPLSYASSTQMFEWIFVMERTLAGLMESGQLPTDWLRDWWAPHNLRFGMLLGYPGIAISSGLWAEAHNRINGIEDPTSEIIVAKEGKYFGARVSFYIHSEAVNETAVERIVHVWKQTIKQVYDELPQQELLRNPKFAESYRNLEILETTES